MTLMDDKKEKKSSGFSMRLHTENVLYRGLNVTFMKQKMPHKESTLVLVNWQNLRTIAVGAQSFKNSYA